MWLKALQKVETKEELEYHYKDEHGEGVQCVLIIHCRDALFTGGTP